uniref:DUF1713 domain-containing protein n=1 Tax=Macrostomum lignano TaxID=282301 RepID=A0A1I8IUE8_9PLAT
KINIFCSEACSCNYACCSTFDSVSTIDQCFFSTSIWQPASNGQCRLTQEANHLHGPFSCMASNSKKFTHRHVRMHRFLPRPNRLLLEAAAAITQPARTIIWPRGHLDIVNRRRRMKRHQLKKFRKRCAAMLRDKRLLREKKKEAEFQEQLHHMKLRTFGSDPFRKLNSN